MRLKPLGPLAPALVCVLTSYNLPGIAAAPSIRPVPIGTRLELMVDDYLLEKLTNTRLELHQPYPAGVAIRFDAPWEGSFTGYITIIKDSERFRMYYRGLPVDRADGSEAEVTCYAESSDGITWSKPKLGLFEVHGTKDNNVVLANQAPFSHNFSPFIDTRPAMPAAERFKALAGTASTGLFLFVSPDGLRWRKLFEKPILKDAAFDSQNVGFWSESEQCYVVYYRTWSKGGFGGFRSVSRAASADLLKWKSGTEMQFGSTPREHLYTSQTHPYFRAPHLYIATPMRFFPGKKVLTDEEAAALGVQKGYAGDCADAVLMTSRGSNVYTRTFMEGLIRPGPDPGNWASRAGLTALGIVPTGPAEMSIYKQAHYAQPTTHLVRYVWRTDGFASVNAGYSGGEMLTRPLLFSGRELVLNFSTSAAGSIRIELQDESGAPLPGFALADTPELIGDEIERVIRWKSGTDISRLWDKPVRLRFVLKDADLYSLRFRP
jgi:hypothetical protein